MDSHKRNNIFGSFIRIRPALRTNVPLFRLVDAAGYFKHNSIGLEDDFSAIDREKSNHFLRQVIQLQYQEHVL